jgi:DNA repair protein RecO (recombination protein O)
LLASLESIDAAGMALRWVRHVCPPRTREPEAWETLEQILDALDDAGRTQAPPRVVLARGALKLLADVGYALDLERCVRCGKECPPGKPARVDPARGGLVCSSCGGAPVVMSAELRGKALDPSAPMSPAEAEEVLAIVDTAMAAHAGFDR